VNITHVLYEITATRTNQFRNLDVQSDFKVFFHYPFLNVLLKQQIFMNLPHVLPEIKTFFFMILSTYKLIPSHLKVNDLAI